MLKCPSCTTELKKDNRHGESVWECPECKNIWFILNIPGADYYLNKRKKREKTVRSVKVKTKFGGSITRKIKQ